MDPVYLYFVGSILQFVWIQFVWGVSARAYIFILFANTINQQSWQKKFIIESHSPVFSCVHIISRLWMSKLYMGRWVKLWQLLGDIHQLRSMGPTVIRGHVCALMFKKFFHFTLVLPVDFANHFFFTPKYMFFILLRTLCCHRRSLESFALSNIKCLANQNEFIFRTPVPLFFVWVAVTLPKHPHKTPWWWILD